LKASLELITEHFSTELNISKDLLFLLQREEEVLAHQEIQNIPDITQEKNKLILEFIQLRSMRIKNLSSLGLPRDETEISAWVAKQAYPSLQLVWQELTDLLKKCQEINQINGMMIQKLSATNRSAIQLLVGQDPMKSLYGPSVVSSTSSKFNTTG
jgi:flagellar biosynthesis/type III secretory pathway chaperone